MSRTYNDGGIGSNWVKFLKKYEHSSRRMRERIFCSHSDNDFFDSNDIEKNTLTYNYWRANHTKFYRWLCSHIGENWDEVYSKLVLKAKEFFGKDSVLLLKWFKGIVEVTPNPRFPDNISCFRYNFYVDKNGLLQKKKRFNSKIRVPIVNIGNVTKWLNGRVVGVRGGKLYWFKHVSKDPKHGRISSDHWKCEFERNKLQYHYLANKVKYNKVFINSDIVLQPIHEKFWLNSYGNFGFRQSDLFSKRDIEFWNKIPKYYQEIILEWSPLNSKFICV